MSTLAFHPASSSASGQTSVAQPVTFSKGVVLSSVTVNVSETVTGSTMRAYVWRVSDQALIAQGPATAVPTSRTDVAFPITATLDGGVQYAVGTEVVTRAVNSVALVRYPSAATTFPHSHTDGDITATLAAPVFTTTPGGYPASPFTTSGHTCDVVQAVAVTVSNRAPNAPAWATPNNSSMPFDQDNVLAWAFSDDDPGDSQSAFNLNRWTLDGSGARVGAPVAVYRETPAQQYTLAANTLTLGTRYEFQVDTLDSQGAEGPYSTSLFVNAVASPAGPTITAPTNGSTVPQSVTLTWSTPNQDAVQFRRVGDNVGAADTSTVYYDSGELDTPASRDATLYLDTNNRYEHIQVRVKYAGLWSPWADVRVLVAYTAPAVAVVTTMPDSANGVMVVGILNPTPTGGEPAVAYNNVWVDDADGKGLIRKAAMLATNTPWTYWLPPSGFDGITVGVVQVEAVATNGTSSWSAAPTPGVVYDDLDGGTATTAGDDYLDGGSI